MVKANLECTAVRSQHSDAKLKGFKIHEITGPAYPALVYGRRDFYKIVLATGHFNLSYGDQAFEINDTFLFFGNPHIPYANEQLSEEQRGYACVFTEEFIGNRERKDSLLNTPLFRFDGTPVVRLNDEEAIFVTSIFQRMQAVYRGGYAQKAEMLRSCIDLIIHEALRIQPQIAQVEKNAAGRMTYLFMDLLEKQFPVEALTQPLKLRTAQDFADQLSVHVNYLNRSVKEITGRPISVHIAERITAEAKALLHHTNWSVSDIAYALGFEYPSYFNNYFKRLSGMPPNSYRKNREQV